ncbi:MAG: hypothetical protein AAGA37_13730 [Actinomycetota bacterium]
MKRYITFFEVEAYKSVGQNLEPVGDLIECLAHVKSLKAKGKNNRYLRAEDGDHHFVTAKSQTPRKKSSGEEMLRGTFARKRLTNLPRLENAGQLSDLQLDKGTGLAELSHFVYFPDSNVLGMEYNHFAPRVHHFGRYLSEKTPHVDLVRFIPLLSPDTFKRVDELAQITRLELRVIGTRVAGISGNNLRGVFSRLRQESPNATRLEARWSVDARDRNPATTVAKSMVEELKAALSVEDSDAIEAAKIVGRASAADPVDTIDLINDSMRYRVDVQARGNGRSGPQPSSVWSAIETKYSQVVEPHTSASPAKDSTNAT